MKAPVVQAFGYQLRIQSIGGTLQGEGMGDAAEGVVVFSKGYSFALQFPFDEGMAVEPVSHLKRNEGPHPQDHRAERLVPNVEVVVHVAAALRGKNDMIRFFGRILRIGAAKGETLLLTAKDEIHPKCISARHRPQRGQHVIFLA
jgi:hypothetical protein